LFYYLDLQLSDDSDVDPTMTLGDLSGSSSEESERDIGDNILNHYLSFYIKKYQSQISGRWSHSYGV
jgi:hypothetical protein